MTPRVPSWPAAVSAIALNTFREAIRDRILYLLVAFTLVLIAASRLLALLTVGSEAKIVKDLGLSAIALAGVLTAVFVGVSLVFKEIEKRTLYTLLATPVRRSQLVVGKYCGLLAVILLNVALMGGALCLLLAVRGESPAPLVVALVLIGVQLAIVTAFAVLFSCFTNPILSALGTLAVYVVGQLAWSFDLLSARVGAGFGRQVCVVLAWLAPNLDRLDLKAQAVHGLAVPPGYVAAGLLYGIGYSIAVLLAACLVFSRREFL
jgi:ABC-type transport system involved in multi-copper enzyme maturation permease subunit